MDHIKSIIHLPYIFLRNVYRMCKFYLIPPNYGGKVFCIGYIKTGTTSIGKSLEMLGYRNCTFNDKVWNYYTNNEIEKVIKYAAKFDSFDDLPWLKEDMIPILDKTFPNSKFIYLQRDETSWKASLYNWKHKMYGEYPDVDKGWSNYKAHEKFVLEYFQDRPSSEFIILDVRDEKGFRKLSEFLGKPIKTDRFPHYNKT